MADDEWKVVFDYDVSNYSCGLRAGQTIALIRDLVITDPDGPTGEIERKGERYRILNGSSHDPGVVFLMQKNGVPCTWNDDPKIFEWFEVVDEDSPSAR